MRVCWCRRGQKNSSTIPVQEEQGAERLVVRGHRHPALIGEHGQELRHLRRSHVARMPHWPDAPAPTDEKPDPIAVGLLGLEAIVLVAQYLAQLLQQALRLGNIDDRVHDVTENCECIQYFAAKACCQADCRPVVQVASGWVVVLIPSDILGWPVYPTNYITLGEDYDERS